MDGKIVTMASTFGRWSGWKLRTLAASSADGLSANNSGDWNDKNKITIIINIIIVISVRCLFCSPIIILTRFSVLANPFRFSSEQARGCSFPFATGIANENNVAASVYNIVRLSLQHAYCSYGVTRRRIENGRVRHTRLRLHPIESKSISRIPMIPWSWSRSYLIPIRADKKASIGSPHSYDIIIIIYRNNIVYTAK